MSKENMPKLGARPKIGIRPAIDGRPAPPADAPRGARTPDHGDGCRRQKAV